MAVDVRRCLFGVTVLATAACGSSATKAPDAAVQVDASPDASPLPLQKVASLLFVEEVVSGNNITLSGATFADVEQLDSIRSDGPCTINVATRGTSTNVTAGTVTITYGSGKTITLAPNPQDNSYSNIAQQFLYRAGDVISVSATGATVPAFTSSITFPASVTVTSPTSLSTLSKSGITATWNATTSPVHIQINQYLDSMHGIFVACSFAGSAGTGAVPATALMDLVAGSSTYFTITTQVGTTGNVGQYSLSGEAAVVAFTTSNVIVQP
jgi:hypothetical protein